MKALYHESNKVEDWETALKEETDFEEYRLEDGLKENVSTVSFSHKLSVQDILNNGENVISLNNYKNSVQKLLNLEDTLPLIPEDA